MEGREEVMLGCTNMFSELGNGNVKRNHAEGSIDNGNFGVNACQRFKLSVI